MQLDRRASRMLLADWFRRLGLEAGLPLTQYGSSGEAFSVGDPKGLLVTAQHVDHHPYLAFRSNDPSLTDTVERIAAQAAARVANGELGATLWYSGAFQEPPLKMSAFSLIGDFVSRLGSQTRIAGWRRLTEGILLEFLEEASETTDAVAAPRATVNFHVSVQGPREGHFSSAIAHGVVETVGAICAFALGRPVELPFGIFPSKPELVEELERRRGDRTIGTLARKGVSLDIFSPLARDAGERQISLHVRNALLSFDAAGTQTRDRVACILYVVAAECLTVPPTKWKDSKLTKRFREFFDQLMPADLDQIVQHANFEEAFGIRRGQRQARSLRREALERFYDIRSGDLHEGIGPSYQGFGPLDTVRWAQRALLRDFAEAAILRYLAKPRSSLIGHPMFDRHPAQEARLARED